MENFECRIKNYSPEDKRDAGEDGALFAGRNDFVEGEIVRCATRDDGELQGGGCGEAVIVEDLTDRWAKGLEADGAVFVVVLERRGGGVLGENGIDGEAIVAFGGYVEHEDLFGTGLRLGAARGCVGFHVAEELA